MSADRVRWSRWIESLRCASREDGEVSPSLPEVVGGPIDGMKVATARDRFGRGGEIVVPGLPCLVVLRDGAARSLEHVYALVGGRWRYDGDRVV